MITLSSETGGNYFVEFASPPLPDIAENATTKNAAGKQKASVTCSAKWTGTYVFLMPPCMDLYVTFLTNLHCLLSMEHVFCNFTSLIFTQFIYQACEWFLTAIFLTYITSLFPPFYHVQDRIHVSDHCQHICQYMDNSHFQMHILFPIIMNVCQVIQWQSL
jgi:hypothetical protein